MQVRMFALLPVLVFLPATAYAQSVDFVTIQARQEVNDTTPTRRTIPLRADVPVRLFTNGSAECPLGYTVVSGGYGTDSGKLTVRDTQPWEYSGQEGWFVTVEHAPGTDHWFNVYARCMRITSVGPEPESADWTARLRNGNTIYVVLNQLSTNHGSLQAGATYKVTYAVSPSGVESFTTEGPDYHSRGRILTATYSNAQLASQELSLWGARFRFDSDGTVWLIHGARATDPQLAGQLSTTP